jgi:prophage regulatory protein
MFLFHSLPFLGIIRFHLTTGETIPMDGDAALRILRLNEVMLRTGYSKATIWRLQKSGAFPQRLRLGEQAVGWLESEIDDWIRSRSRGELCRAPVRKRVRARARLY